MLYSVDPQSAVEPPSRTRVSGWPPRYFACAATTSVPVPLISLLSKSKYTRCVASSPACGPAASSSAPAAALALLAPEPCTPSLAAGAAGGRESTRLNTRHRQIPHALL